VNEIHRKSRYVASKKDYLIFNKLSRYIEKFLIKFYYPFCVYAKFLEKSLLLQYPQIHVTIKSDKRIGGLCYGIR
jgi:hypothetical protein